MKKVSLLVVISLAGLLLAQSAMATITFGTTTPSQTIAASGTFQITLTLDVTQSTAPANVGGYDAIFEALAVQNGYAMTGFSITGSTAPASQPTWLGINQQGQFLAAGSDHSGYVQTGDQGYAGDNGPGHFAATPISGLQLATYTFSYAGLATGSYTFQTTLQATSAGKFSDVADSNGAIFPATARATFTVGIPEPASWSLLALGGIAAFGLNLARTRLKG